jgi:hypothetical protein
VIERPAPPMPPPESPGMAPSQPLTQTQTQKDDPDMILKSLKILSELVSSKKILFHLKNDGILALLSGKCLYFTKINKNNGLVSQFPEPRCHAFP